MQGEALSRELRALGVSIRVVALTASASADAALDVRVLGRRALAPLTLRRLAQETRSTDLAIGYGSTTLPALSLVSAATRRPFIYRSIGNPADWARGSLHRARTRALFTRPVHVAALFDRASASLGSLYGVAPERRSVIPNARSSRHFVPPSAEERGAARRALGVSSDGPVIAFIGALADEKRPQVALDVFDHVEGATLVVAGDGPQRTALEAGVARRGRASRVRLLGAIPDVRPVLAAADVLLITSSTEGMPGSAIEAALMGVPSVAPDVGAVREVVSEGGRVVAQDAVAQEYAHAIADVSAERDRLGDVARAHVMANFTWDVVAPVWLGLIERIAERSPTD